MTSAPLRVNFAAGVVSARTSLLNSNEVFESVSALKRPSEPSSVLTVSVFAAALIVHGKLRFHRQSPPGRGPVVWATNTISLLSRKRIGGINHIDKLIRHFLGFMVHLGYFGPLLMGALDSSFLFLPFGNDLLVVTLVARNHQGLPWYVLAASIGSTIGVSVLAVAAGKLGQEGIKKMAGRNRFDKLSRMIDEHGAKAVVLACIAPPPFPFTMVIAAAAALKYSRLRIAVINFFTRGVRFIILGVLAIKYGNAILELANSPVFRGTMIGFISLCVAGSAFSIYGWLKNV